MSLIEKAGLYPALISSYRTNYVLPEKRLNGILAIIRSSSPCIVCTVRILVTKISIWQKIPADKVKGHKTKLCCH